MSETMNAALREARIAMEDMRVAFEATGDDRRPEERFRIYRVRERKLVCVCSTEHPEGVFPAILDQLDPEAGATLTPSDAIGVLDCQGDGENPLDEFGCYTLSGAWKINPFVRGA